MSIRNKMDINISVLIDLRSVSISERSVRNKISERSGGRLGWNGNDQCSGELDWERIE